MIRAATLFSGIGAPEAARPGWRWLWHAEIEPFPAAVLAARHPRSVNLGDVTSHDFAHRALAIGRPDVLVFGSPCQSFSVVGRRLGLDDPRGNLALVALAVVRAVRPAWFLFENVPGLLSSEGGRDFGTFLRAVAECGYLGCWRVLDAQHFGLAQRRQRVFFVGCLGDWRPAAEVLFEPESLRGHPPPSREAGQGIAPGLGASLAGGDDADAADDLIAFDTTQVTSPANRSQPQPGDPCHPLASRAHAPAIAYGGDNRHGGHYQPEVTAAAIRRLTPVECERLMGFPDGHTAIAHRGKPAADGPRYRALGNSMAVPVVRWLLTRIEARMAATATEEDAA